MESLYTVLFEGIFVTLIRLIGPVFLMFALILVYKVQRYHKSLYYKQTRHSYFKVVQDAGLYGEYLCTAEIESKFSQPLILTNVYLPHPSKKDRTTEVDLIFINQSGIHVIESKNYSGWIFGRKRDKYWTQALPSRKKNRFFNPIMQNELHLKAIEKALELNRTYLHSWIVFSNRSTLKQIESTEIPVLNRQQWIKKLATFQNSLLDYDDQMRFYQLLLPFTEVDASVIHKHIQDIKTAKSPLK